MKKIKLNEDSSNIISVNDMAVRAIFEKQEVQIKKLTNDNVGLSQTIDKLLVQLEEKVSEIRHLQEMLSATVPIVGQAQPLILSDEEIIAEFQLKALKSAAMSRDLTLDEVKRYDLLVKNKRLAQGNATTIEGKKTSKTTNTGELIKLASKPMKDE